MTVIGCLILGAVLSLLLYCVQAASPRPADRPRPVHRGRWRTCEVPERLPAGELTVLYYGGVNFFAELPHGYVHENGLWLRCLVLSSPQAPCLAILRLAGRSEEFLVEGGPSPLGLPGCQSVGEQSMEEWDRIHRGGTPAGGSSLDRE